MSTSNLDSADLKAVDFGGTIREDVMDEIWDISDIPLPLTDIIGSGSTGNSYKEWTTDELASPDVGNATVDGADATGNDTATGARVGNHCQIPDKIVRVSTRGRESDTIGHADELGYQIMMRQRELRRDVEAIALTEQASIADNGDAQPGLMGGLGAWLETNTSRGALGADGGFANGIVAAPTAGTVRALSEGDVRDVSEQCFLNGGNPSVLMSVPQAIRALSTHMFGANSGIATLQSNVGNKREATIATGAVQTFVTDHGIVMDFVANRIQQPEDTDRCNVYLIDPEFLDLTYLHGYKTEPLAKTGTADNRQMTVDVTLCVRSEKAHGVVADVDFTLAAAA